MSRNSIRTNLVGLFDTQATKDGTAKFKDFLPFHTEGASCHSCGAVFTKSSARFCSKCGTKKVGSPFRPNSTTRVRTGCGSISSAHVAPGADKDMIQTRTAYVYEPIPHASASMQGAKDNTALDKTTSCALSSTNRKPFRKEGKRLSIEGSDYLENRDVRFQRGSMVPDTIQIGVVEKPEGSTEGAVRPPTLSSTAKARLTQSVEFSGTDDSIGYNMQSTINASPEEEAQYSAWATLSPDGLTPEMLQTPNAKELKCWRKGNLLGRGSYGSVYLGLLPNGNFHAVKVVDLSQNASLGITHFNAKMLVSLSREINIMRQLRHRNLCGFTGVYYDSNSSSICIFIEYISGGSLSEIVRRFKPLPPRVVRSWTKQLLSGLLYLHSQNIMHRDIKADNVLVDTNMDAASESQIKLVDFGASRRLIDAVSQSKTVIGTPYWMAPEIIDIADDNVGYNYKADVWSVGCTVAEMLTGKPPWPIKSNAPQTIMMIASSQGLPTELPKDEASPGCYDFMLQCFERDPDKRPTVEQLLHHPWIRGEMD